MAGAVHDGCTDVVLDLTAISFADSSAAHGLAWSRRHAVQAGGSLRVGALSPAVDRLLRPGPARRELSLGLTRCA